MKRIRTGDEVIVISGKSENKGRRGRVTSVREEYVIVEGMNFISKHVKPNRQLQTEGNIVRKEAPIHISNVMIFNPGTNKGDRVGFKVEEGKKFRIYKSTGAIID
ncbi:50S ribosomal protein L24 [Cardiobacterium valvarum]|uniref:50S ribosomal protein L24 n=1 Tax=Cardiobacterium valvarum TaxID=194702 RepID=UPI000E20B5FE